MGKMSSSKDERKASTSDQSTIHSMADLALDSLKKEYKTDWDPFELYELKLKSHVYSEHFYENFQKGYETLLSVLREK